MRILKILFLTVFVFLFAVCSVSAATIVVNPGDSIQTAINSAGDGDVIKIAAGIYNEQLTVDGFTGLTLIGAGQGLTIIDGTGLGAIDLITISFSSKITLKGCTVNGAGVNTNTLVLGFVANVNILNCTIADAVANGIFSALATRITVKNCLLQNNGTYGMNVGGAYNTTVMSSQIQNNGTGIHIIGCHNTLIAKNTIAVNSAIGLEVVNTQNSVVKQNTITANGTDGIAHSSTDTFGNMYLKNTIAANLGNGVHVNGGLPTFSGNLITGNLGIGFYSEGGAYSTLLKNTISSHTGAGGYGVGMVDSSGYLSKNNITGNIMGGVVRSLILSTPVSKILTVTSNKINANGIYGLYSADTTGEGIMDARKNFFSANAVGMLFTGNVGAFIDKNKATANGTAGIAGGLGAIATVTGNLVSAGGPGIVTEDFAVIYKNKVYGNAGPGIAGFNLSHLEKNVVQGNQGHGIDASMGAFSLIENNKVFGNGNSVTTFDLNDNSPLDDIWLDNKYGTSSW